MVPNYRCRRRFTTDEAHKKKIAQSTLVKVKAGFSGKSYFCSVPIFNFLLFRFSAPYGEGCTHCRGRKERFLDFPIHSNT